VKSHKVLVIDDSEIASEAAQEVLRAEGFDVRACTALGEFTEILKHWHPDVVLTDMHMPTIQGTELCYWIKSTRGGRGKSPAKVILYSAAPEDELELFAKTSGADAFVCKDRGMDAMRDVVLSLTGKD
jgi:CheY-like chemotaxis protein